MAGNPGSSRRFAIFSEVRPDASPRVTIAIAAFNAAETIGAALRSACAQTEQAIEIIVVDDCSTDGTLAVVEQMAVHDQRLRIVRSGLNLGPAGARNRALEMARGDWFTVLDADDLYSPERTARLLDAARESGADIVADNPVAFTASAPGEARFLRSATTARWIDLSEYLAMTVMYEAGEPLGYLKPLIRLAPLHAAGICYEERLRVGEDDDLVMRLLGAGLRYRLESWSGYAYRRHSGSTSYRLSAANASAMERVAAEHCLDPRLAPWHPALESRRQGFARARDFALLIDALKSRKLADAATIALRTPAVLPLLGEPLRVRWHRLTGAATDTLASSGSGEDSEAMAFIARVRAGAADLS